MSLKRLRYLLWLAVAVAAVAMAVLLIRRPGQPAPAVESVAFGGPFNLTDANGVPFSSVKLAGKPFAMFFGFTHCPDVCPTTLARLARLRRQLGKGEDSFAIVFVTVDPERDGPKEVGSYTAMFGTPVIGLTGSPAEIDRVKKQFGVYSAKVEQPGADYSVDHTAVTFLFGPDSKFVATIAPDENDAAALDKLKRIIG
jgi:protein SCO1/2